MEKEELNNQELWDKFLIELEKFKDAKVIIEAEERIVAYYQTAESPELEFEEGETALTPEEYAIQESVHHKSFEIDSLINPNKEIENDGFVIHSVKGELTFRKFISILEGLEIWEYNGIDFYDAEYIENELREVYTVPERIKEDVDNSIKTIKAEHSDLDVTWMNFDSVDQYDLTILLSEEVYDFIEKFQEENS